MKSIAPRLLVAIAIAAFVAFAYWPGLDAFWGRDDFMQLAFARMVGSPWPLFVHDHYFPVPGSIFRPLGFASFWLWQALFGVDYRAHALGDLALHVAVALALYRVIRVAARDRAEATLCALAFALHPVALGTALWWSARFDLLAALFALIALRGAFDYVERRRVPVLGLTLVAALAALLSKETAAAALVAIACAWLSWARRDAAARTLALRALAGLCAVAIVYFAWRAIVLGTASTALVGDVPLASAMTKGIEDWARHLAGYLTFGQPLGLALRGVLIAIGLFFVAAVALARGAQALGRERRDLLLCGLVLFVLPAVLQSPVAALNATPLGADTSAVEAAMQSRLYYLSFAGLAIVFAVVVAYLSSNASRWSRVALPALLAVTAFGFGVSSRELASEYAQRAAEPATKVAALLRAVDHLALPARRCHVVVEGLAPPPEWSIYVSPDSIVKALAADERRVDGCFFHADYPTYFHLMRRGALAEDALPYRAHRFHDREVPWLDVGGVTVAYLDAPESAMPDAGAIVLRYDGAEFREVAP